LKFVDEARIFIRSGDGGRGCVSFRREKFKPFGGPDGGDGGRGGDVVITGTARLHSLLDFRYRRHFKAAAGGHGAGNDRHGRQGRNLRITVPLGTVVREAETGRILADLTSEGQSLVAAQGGRGGKGNRHFATATHQAPRFAQEGEPGMERWLLLELKLLAQVGLVGLPNAGKSTLLSRISSARPKVADYPFTTLTPNLGVVSDETGRRLTVADVPGLVEDAASGAGLGLKFLRHVERTLGLIYLIDGSEANPLKSFEILLKEMQSFDPRLLEKPALVAVNKIDLPQSRAQFPKIAPALTWQGRPPLAVSAETGEGIPELVAGMFRLTETL
jgi:GTP-binding protein